MKNNIFEEYMTLANTDASALSIGGMMEFAYNLSLITFFEKRNMLIDITEQRERYVRDLNPKTSSQIIEERRHFFAELVNHVAILLETAVSKDPQFYISHPFSYRVVRGDNGNPESSAFEPQKNESDVLNVEFEKYILTTRFIEIVNNHLELIDRIRRCRKCNRFFYQPTKREKNYCSKQCAGAVRQKKFQDSRKSETKRR